MAKLSFIFGDQLSLDNPALKAINPQQDLVLLCEVAEEASYVPHHPQKIAFIFAAMRHFAQELIDQGFQVAYQKLSDANNTGSFAGELQRCLQAHTISEVLITAPGEWRVLNMLHSLQQKLSIPLTILEDSRFLATMADFQAFAKGKKQLRMEYFYRSMRQKYNILMTKDGQPEGGKWNFDQDNRKNANHLQNFPNRPEHPIDSITEEVLDLVKAKFNHNFGDLEPFNYAVTRTDARQDLNYFIQHILTDFGTYQDAMYTGEISLFHSRLALYINVGLLSPLEVCQQAEQAYYANNLALNSVEGFIRQILGWREYVRGIYWLFMPEYKQRNFFNAQRPLPEFYWGAATSMHCIQEVVRQTKVSAYSHHIQRLMITGNFALLAGLEPKAVCDWYLAVYADAYEWVELPNTLGMALFADAGTMASKPYAASGKYINRMSNFCKSCQYNPQKMTEDDACPFNALYWNFLHTNQQQLQNNQRLVFAYKNWHKMNEHKQQAILAKAEQIFEKLANQTL